MGQLHEIEHVFMNGSAHLEVICGPMFSGKTEELIRRIRRVGFAKMKALMFKPAIDNRHKEDLMVSHSKQSFDSISVAHPSEIRRHVENIGFKVRMIGIDEVQFFDESIVDVCLELVENGVGVIVAGLGEDYLGNPFGAMPRLLSHADSVTKLWAICMKCGALASKSQRIFVDNSSTSNSQILVGDERQYEARCRKCHKKTILPIHK